MPDFSKRSTTIEIMDDLTCEGPIVDQTLIELEFINKWLGGNAVTLNGLKKLLRTCSSVESLKIADLGCGGGDMLKLITNELRINNQKVELIGIDANPNIIAYAEKNSKSYSEISFKALNIFSEEFKREKYDMVFATLFLHHFTREELIIIFSLLKKNVRYGVVVNDLNRHWLAYYSIKLLTGIFSKSPMVVNDAPLSVHRGFKKDELVEILKTAGITRYSLKWKWAFRWQLIINLS